MFAYRRYLKLDKMQPDSDPDRAAAEIKIAERGSSPPSKNTAPNTMIPAIMTAHVRTALKIIFPLRLPKMTAAAATPKIPMPRNMR